MKKYLIFALIVISFAFYTRSTFAADQVYNGDIISIRVNDDRSLDPNIRVKPSTNISPGDPYVTQYFAQHNWSTKIHLGSGIIYTGRYGAEYGGIRFTTVSNNLITNSKGGTIITVGDLGSTGVTLTQKLIYENGTRYVTKIWEIGNSGPNTYNNVKLFHGAILFLAVLILRTVFLIPI